jgi:hypothetical protein
MNYRQNVVYIILSILFLLAQVISWKFYAGETVIVLMFLLLSALSRNFTFSTTNIFIPQNIVFGVFFIRLYIIPLTGILWGYNHEIPLPPFSQSQLFLSYLIIVLSYFAFLIGWESQYSFNAGFKAKIHSLDRPDLKKLMFFFLLFGIIPLFVYFHSIREYLLQVFVFNKDKSESMDKWGNLVLIYSKYFFPFSVYCFSSLIDFKKKNKIITNLILIGLLILILLFSLSSNRQSMVYPILGLLAGFSGKILRFRFTPLILTAGLSLYLLFMFKEMRSISVASPEIETIGMKGVATTIQIYGGGPQIVAPALNMDLKQNTIYPSFFSSVPVFGKPLRERSGVSVYNVALYGFSGVAEDQVFPTAAESFANGGILLVIVFFIFAGFAFAALNRLFLSVSDSDVLYRGALFYLALLLNASFLLSFQVMGQFLFYNSIPAFMIITIYYLRKKHKEGKSRLL